MNVPQLRFDGFEEKWEVKKLSDVAIIKGGFAFPSQRFKNEKSNYQVIKMGNLYNNKLDLDRSPSYLDSISDRDQEYLLNEGDIIITLTGTVHKTDFGYSHMITNERNLLVNQRLALVKSKPNSDSFFLLNLIRHKRFLQQFFTSSIGGTGNQANVSTKTMEGFSIVTPSLLEQKKISNFFTLLNNRISKQQEKIEKLEQFKKGMMQKIFSQELRFKDEDGGDFSAWKEVALSNLGTTYTGLSGKTKEDFGHGEASFVTYVNVFNNLKASIDGLQAVDLSDGKNQNPVCLGDILFTTSSETPHEVGMASYWGFDQKEVYLNSFCFGFRLTNGLVNGEFLTYLLRSPIYRAVITLLAQGSTRYNISKTGLMKMKVLLPSMKEQKKIVGLLSQIDTKLNKEKEKLVILEEQKKGFMQGMFV